MITNMFKTAAEYIFFSRAHKTFSRVGHKLRYKTSLKNLRKLIYTSVSLLLISSILYSYSVIQLNNDKKENIGKILIKWKLNNTFLKKQWITREPKGKSKNILGQTKMELQNMETWNAAKAVERRKFIEINANIKKQRKKQLSNI